MPAYSFVCEKCSESFEIICSIKDYKDSVNCIKCKTNKHVHRLYIEDLKTLNTSVKKSDNELKTIGDLANRNRDRMSNDEINSLSKKHNEYKEEAPKKELPTGMSRLKKQTKTKWT